MRYCKQPTKIEGPTDSFVSSRKVICNAPVSKKTIDVTVCGNCGRESGHNDMSCYLGRQIDMVQAKRTGHFCERGHLAPIQF